jgi:O-antigen ligase
MTTTAAAPAPLVATDPAPLRSGEWATLAFVAALLVLALPSVFATTWTPKSAVALVALVPGVLVLVRGAVGRDRAAIVAVAFLAAASLATVLSPSPRLSLVGLYNDGTGLLFVGVVIGAWALGRRLSPRATRLLGSVVLAGAVANAVMAWLQMSSSFGNDGLFQRYDGRAPGFLGNPVHVSALLVGAFALALERACAPAPESGRRTDRIAYLAACALFASGVQLSGGRTGLVLIGVVVLIALVRHGWRSTLVAAALVVVGVTIASVAFTAGTGAAGRLAGTDSGGIGGRVDRWRLAIPAVEDRPVLGTGPGLWRRATSPHDTVAAARAFGAEALYQNAHNLFVEYAVTTGVVGVALLAAWLVLAALGARGELVWFAAFGAVSLLLQPQVIGLTPVLALALGAAGPTRLPGLGAAGRALAAVGVVVGVAAGAALVRGDHEFGRAADDGCPATARRAADLLPLWPDPAAFAARLETDDRGCAPGGMGRDARRDLRTAIRRDPSWPTAWSSLADLELAGGRTGAARRAYEQALHWNPQSTLALAGLAGIAREDGRATDAARLCRRYHALLPDGVCPPVRD